MIGISGFLEGRISMQNLGRNICLSQLGRSPIDRCAVGPSAQARYTAQQEEEKERADSNLRRVRVTV